MKIISEKVRGKERRGGFPEARMKEMRRADTREACQQIREMERKGEER